MPSLWTKLNIKRSFLSYAYRWKFLFLLLVSASLTVFLSTGIFSSLASATVADTRISVTQNPISTEPSAASLVQQGKELYEAGQLATAVKVLKQATEAYQKQGDARGVALTLSNLSLAYQKLGQWSEASDAINTSLQLIGQQNQVPETLKILAPALNIQGSLQQRRGESEQAVTSWQQAAAIYAQLGDEHGKNQALINQTQALQALGLYRRALDTLEQVNQNLQSSSDSRLKVVLWRSLGSALRTKPATECR